MPAALPTIYEYFFDSDQGKWIPWQQLIPKYIHEPDKKFNEILVPTVDTVRTTWLLGLQCKIRRPVLLVGETGTSKTATISNFLRELDKETNVIRLHNIWTTMFIAAHFKIVYKIILVVVEYEFFESDHLIGCAA